MAWNDLKSAVAAVIQTNGTQAITGALLQSTLNSIIDQVGANASYKGIAIPSTTPGTPDGVEFYLASQSGTYSNFSGYVHKGDSLILFTNTSGSWVAVDTGVSSTEKMNTRIERKLGSGNLLDQNNLFDGWINTSGGLSYTSGYQHTEYLPISEGETIYANVSAGGNPQIALYDENKTFLSSVASTAQQITGTANARYVRWSILTSVLTSTSGIFSGSIPSIVLEANALAGYTEKIRSFEKDNEVFIGSKLNIADDLTLIATSYSTGIFEDAAQTSWHTSDFIEVFAKENLNYYISFGDLATSEYSLVRFYDRNQNEIFRINGDSTGRPKTVNLPYQINFPADTKYVKYATLISATNTGLFSAVPKSLEECIASKTDPIELNKVDVNVEGGNLFNQNLIEPGWVDSSGSIIIQSGYSHIQLPIEAGQTFVANHSAESNPQIVIKNSSGTVLLAVPSSNKAITAPANAAYVLWSLLDSVISGLGKLAAIYEDEIPPNVSAYTPVHGYTKNDVLLGDNVLIKSKFNIKSQLSVVATTYTVGIFEDAAQTSYHTSDFIEIEATENKNYFIEFGNTMSSSYTLMRFYDRNQNEIYRLPGSSAERPKTANLPYQINFPSDTKYIKYSTVINQPETGLLVGTAKSLEECIRSVFSGVGSILWLGTSIPEGAEYPTVSSEKVGYTCINNSRGSSGIIFNPVAGPPPFATSAGFSLSATVAEKETKWRPYVTSGDITEAQLDTWKLYSYENLLLPHLDDVDAIVIDHGFNDRYDLPAVVAAGENSIDWDSTDRTTFLGALRYLINEILRRKPFMKIILGGYFQNNFDSNGYNGSSVCKILEWAARHYSMPLLDAWNYSGIGSLYVPDTSDYISNFNTTYGTSYTKLLPDVDGNIMTFQLFCPDKVHPHSDLTGNANKRLNAVFTKLLRDSLI